MGYILKTSRGYYLANVLAILFTDKIESSFIFEKKELAEEVMEEIKNCGVDCELIKL